jgi:hypothetical protein
MYLGGQMAKAFDLCKCCGQGENGGDFDPRAVVFTLLKYEAWNGRIPGPGRGC